jgi:hypothetical protein
LTTNDEHAIRGSAKTLTQLLKHYQLVSCGQYRWELEANERGCAVRNLNPISKNPNSGTPFKHFDAHMLVTGPRRRYPGCGKIFTGSHRITLSNQSCKRLPWTGLGRLLIKRRVSRELGGT